MNETTLERLKVLSFGALLSLSVASGCSLAGRNSVLVVANSADNNLSIVDAQSNLEIRTVDTENHPRALALSHDGNLLAVSNSFSATVSILDTKTQKNSGPSLPVGYYATALAFDEPDRKLWVLSRAHGSLWQIDVPSRKVHEEPTMLGSEPSKMVLVEDRGLFIIREVPEGELIEVDPSTGQIRRRVPMGRSPSDIAWFEPRKTLLVASFSDDEILEVDPATLKVIQSHDVPVGEAIAVHPHKPLVYSVQNFLDTVTVYDMETKTTLKQIPIDSGGTAAVFSPDGRELYVVNYFAGNVSLIDTEANERKGRIAVGTSPVAAAFVP